MMRKLIQDSYGNSLEVTGKYLLIPTSKSWERWVLDKLHMNSSMELLTIITSLVYFF